MKHKWLIITLLIGLVSVCANFSSAEIDDTYDLELFLGEKLNLKTYTTGQDIPFVVDDQTVIQNMNASVVTVDAYYTVRSLEIGKGVLILSSGDKTLRIDITVTSPIESIEFDMNDLTLYVGEIYYLEYSLTAKEGYSGNIEPVLQWESSKPHVAKVADNNRVVTQGAGVTNIIGKMPDGTVVTSFEVRVLGHSYKLQVTAPDRVRKLNVGETLAMKASLGTKDVSDNIYWESLTPHVLKVDQYGFVTAVGEGSGKIRAQSTVKSEHADYEIMAYSMIDKVTLNKTSLDMEAIGQTEQLSFNLYPKNVNNPPILLGYTYKSSNEKVATVSKNGLVTAVGPGIALISVVFDDSQKSSSCTVEVSDKVKLENLNTMPIKGITLKDVYGTAVIGQKIWLDYEVEPKNANQQNLSFKVVNGDNSQIQFIDGAYYFIPNRRGNIGIELTADHNIKDAITVTVTSPIEELDLSLGIRRYTGTDEALLYVGEETELSTRIYAKHGFEKSDVYSSSLKYQVMNEGILELQPLGNTYYVKALKPGKTEIRVTNLENFHEDKLWITVEDPIASFATDDQVVLPVGEFYRPRLNVSINTHTRALTERINFEGQMALSVDQLYVPLSFINQEITYEQNQLEAYGEGPYDLTTYDLVEPHELRLAQLKSYQQNASDDYVLVNSPSNFLDRNNRSYKFYTIKGQQIRANMPLKMVVSVSMRHMDYKAKTTMICQPGDNVLTIKRYSTTYTLTDLIKQYELDGVLYDLGSEEQVKLLITYMNNREKFAHVPTYEVLKATSNVLEKDLLPDSISSLGDELNKTDLAHLSVLLHKKYVNNNPIYSSDTNYYYDVVEPALKNAITLGYIKPKDQYNFGANDSVTEQDFYILVKKFVPSYSHTGTAKTLTGERLILLLNELLLK